MSCLAVRNFYSHNKILLSRVENNLLIDHSKFLKIFCDLYMYCSVMSAFLNIFTTFWFFFRKRSFLIKCINKKILDRIKLIS